jgi:uncharacterized OB-fold protein
MPFHERVQEGSRLKHWPVSIEATYLYTAGVAGEKFFTELKESGKILATECKGCAIEYLPPRVYCERCFADLSDSWHAVAPSGVVEAFTVMRRGLDGKTLEKPEVRAVVRMGKGTGALIHRVLAPPGKVEAGSKVKVVLKPAAKRQGNILDIEGFDLA